MNPRGDFGMLNNMANHPSCFQFLRVENVPT